MKLSGDRNQCPRCNEYFNSTSAFEKHLTGRVATPERRCKTVVEMQQSGMEINRLGFWIGNKMPDIYKGSINEESTESS